MGHRGSTHSVIAMLIMVLFAIIALPFYGIYKLTRPCPEDKLLGGFFLVLGLLIWGCILLY